MCLPPLDRFASEAYITGADVDWESERLLFSLLGKQGVFLDIGAHIGYYALYMKRPPSCHTCGVGRRQGRRE
jgi:hypothetical protein